MEESIENIILPLEKRNKGCFSNLLVLLSLPFIILVLVSILIFQFSLFEKELFLLLSTIFALSALFLKNSPFVKICEPKFLASNFSKEIEELSKELSLTVYRESRSVNDLSLLISNFLENYRIDLINKIFSFSVYFSISLLNLIFLNEKSFFFSLFFSLAIINWQYFLEKRAFEKLKSEVLKVKEKSKELFWSAEELERYKILQNEQINFEIKRSFEKAFTPEFIKNFEYIIKKEITIFFNLTKKEREAQKKLLLEYEKVLKEQKIFIKELKEFKNLESGFFKDMENINSSLKNIIEHLSKELKVLNAISLHTFENIQKEIQNIKNKSFEKISDLNMNIEILNKNFEILETIFSHYQRELNKNKERIL